MLLKLKEGILQPVPARAVTWISALFSAGLFGLILLVFGVLKPDLLDHIKASDRMVEGSLRIGHPMFFFLIQLLSGFSRHLPFQIFAAFLITATSTYFRIVLSLRLVEEWGGNKANWLLFAGMLAGQVAIGFPWALDHYAMGSLSPNFFHNGTLTLCYPFVLLFLIENIRFLRDENRKHIRNMVFLGILTILIKPSFLFCWIPVMPFFTLLFYGANRKLLGILQVAILLVFAIIGQSLLLKQPTSGEFKVVFSPFFLFGTLENHAKVFVSAVAFPLTSIIIYRKYFWENKWALFLALSTVQGLILSFSFHDVLRGMVGPNMTWQSSIFHYLFIVFSLMISVEQVRKGKLILAALPWLVFGLQVANGIRYLQVACLLRSFFI